jgi:hypothetical protein
MSDLNDAQDRTFYRVRIKDGHNAAGFLISGAGKRCIPSTQFWLALIRVPLIAFRAMLHSECRYALKTWGSQQR